MQHTELERTILDLIQSYHDFNPSSVPVLEREPSALEFASYVAAGQPVVIQNAINCAALDWTRSAFLDRIGGKSQTVQVAATPDGRADSVYEQPDGRRIFKEPATLDMPIERLLQITSNSKSTSDFVAYLQSQNSNLSQAPLSRLLPDLPSPPSFAQQAFKGQEPDATNIWIGDHRAVTSLHRDPYENIYLVIKGSKTFTLFPPVEEICLYTKQCQHAQWIYDGGAEDDRANFTTRTTEPPQHLPWVMVDPLAPDLRRWPLYNCARPLTVTLHAGELLYLPSSWYHHVQQAQGQWRPEAGAIEGATSPCIAINWWTDQDYTGEKHVMRDFLHTLVQQYQSGQAEAEA